MLSWLSPELANPTLFLLFPTYKLLCRATATPGQRSGRACNARRFGRMSNTLVYPSLSSPSWRSRAGPILRKLLFFALLALMMLSSPVRADDFFVDGVPLPSDMTVAEASSGSADQQQWGGVWAGAWDGTLVESVSEDGKVKVVYANGENPFRSPPCGGGRTSRRDPC
jgi:hypothetical protein